MTMRSGHPMTLEICVQNIVNSIDLITHSISIGGYALDSVNERLPTENIFDRIASDADVLSLKTYYKVNDDDGNSLIN